MDNNKKALLWSLIGSINVVKHCVSELSHSKVKSGALLNLDKSCNKFMNYASKKLASDHLEELEDLSYDNVAIITECIFMLSQVPSSQIDWMAGEIKKLSFSAVNRHNLGQ